MTTFGLVSARFYDELADRLEAGARATLEAGEPGCAVESFEVPGAFELGVAAMTLARSGRYDGIVCLGAVIRGETDHYDYVCAEAARGIQQVGLETGVPCGFGVLTVDTYEQALARAGSGKRDSGAHAAEAVLSVVAIRRAVGAPPATPTR